MSKGSRREREAVDLYKRAGFAVYRPATVRFLENDIFGLFDLLAVSPSHDHVRGVQVKSNGATGLSDWKRHTALWRRLGWITEYAVPYDYGPGIPVEWCLIDAGQEPEDGRRAARVVVDEREMDCAMGDGVVEYLQEVP